MLEINRMTSETKPDVIEILDVHSYRYNYDIVETRGYSSTDEEDEEPQLVTMYEYTPIIVKGYPNYNECVKSVLREYLPLEDEFKIINEYNENLFLDTDERDESAITTYQNYLALRKHIKSIIKRDFTIWQK